MILTTSSKRPEPPTILSEMSSISVDPLPILSLAEGELISGETEVASEFSRFISILSMCTKVQRSASQFDNDWPYSIETSVETFRCLLAIFEYLTERLATAEDGAMSPAQLRDSCSLGVNFFQDCDIWNGLHLIALIAEANIRAFMCYCDAIDANALALIEDKNPLIKSRSKLKMFQTDGSFVNDSEYDSEEDELLVDKAQQQDESVDPLHDSFESFKYSDSFNSSLKSDYPKVNDAANYESAARVSPAHSISNKSAESSAHIEESFYAKSLSDDSEDWDVQSALLSSYGAENTALEVTIVENAEEVIPRLFDALCNISFTSYKMVSSHYHNATQYFQIWKSVQHMIGGESMRVFLTSAELGRALLDVLINPAELVHIIPGLIMGLHHYITLQDDYVIWETRETSDSLDVIVLKSFLEFVVREFGSRSQLSIASNSERVEINLLVARSLYQLAAYATICWTHQMTGNDRRWRQITDLFSMIEEETKFECKQFQDSSSECSLKIVCQLPYFIGKLRNVTPDLASVPALLPFSINLMHILDISETKVNYILKETSNKLIALLSSNLRFIITLIRRGFVPLDSQSACWSFCLAVDAIQVFRPDYSTSGNCYVNDVWNLASACIKDAWSLKLDRVNFYRPEVVRSNLLQIAETLDTYISSNSNGLRIVSSKQLDMFMDELHLKDASVLNNPDTLSVRRNLFLQYIRQNNLETAATQAYAGIVLSAGVADSSSNIDPMLYCIWGSSHIFSILCTSLVLGNDPKKINVVERSDAPFRLGVPMESIVSAASFEGLHDATLEKFVSDELIRALMSPNRNRSFLILGNSIIAGTGEWKNISAAEILALLTCDKSMEEILHFAFFNELTSSLFAFALSTAAVIIRKNRFQPSYVATFLSEMNVEEGNMGRTSIKLNSVEIADAAGELGEAVAQFSCMREPPGLLKLLVNFYTCMVSTCCLSHNLVVSLVSFAANCTNSVNFSNENDFVNNCDFLETIAGAVGQCSRYLERRIDAIPYSALMNALNEELCGQCSKLAEGASKLFSTLGAYIKTLTFAKTTIISTFPRNLEVCTPTIQLGLNTPHGGYTLDFWIKISNGQVNVPKYLHVLSRLPDTLDFNIISLLECKLQHLCHPSIYLEMTSNDVVTMHVCTAASQGSVVGITHNIVTDAWVHCAVQYKQGRGGSDEKNSNEMHFPSTLSLYIDGTMVKTLAVPYIKYKLNGRLVLGGIPRALDSASRGTLVCDIHFSSYQKSSLDDSSATQEKIRVFVSKFPPNLIARTICNCLLLMRHIFEIILSYLRSLDTNDIEEFSSRWSNLKELILTAVCVGDEPTASVVLKVFDFFVSKCACDAQDSKFFLCETFRIDLLSTLETLIGMTFTFVDPNLENRLDSPIIDSRRRVWFDRVLGTNSTQNFFLNFYL